MGANSTMHSTLGIDSEMALRSALMLGSWSPFKMTRVYPVSRTAADKHLVPCESSIAFEGTAYAHTNFDQ
eukprot:622148-Amphidinium_carterae.1